jgi:hypothetical protein
LLIEERMENTPIVTAKTLWRAVWFWVAVACFLVVAFNYQDSMPKVLGYSMADVIAAGLMVSIWIGTWFRIARSKKRPQG